MYVKGNSKELSFNFMLAELKLRVLEKLMAKKKRKL